MKRRTFLHAATAAPALALQGNSAGQENTGPHRRDLLSRKLDIERIAAILAPRDKWHPWPTALERDPWNAIPPDVRKAVVDNGENALETAWPVLPATLALEFARNGNRSHFERARDIRRGKVRDLVMAECVEGKGRFADAILDGVWITCEETFWGVPAHLGMQKAGVGLPDATEPVIDLFAAETAAMLAWTLYLTGNSLDAASKLVRPRILAELERRILIPGFERDDFWWMGLRGERELNNWTPWITLNWLTTVLLCDRDATRRTRTVHKCVRVLDNFLNGYHDDGGCDEGPSYWNAAGAALFEALELLHSATNGAADFYKEPLIRDIGRYIYRAHIYDDWYTNFADASAKNHIAGDVVYRYGKRIEDPDMMGLGAWAAARSRTGSYEKIGRALPAVFDIAELRQAKAYQPLVRDVWLPGIQVMAARRKAQSPEGLYLAAQGGHNAESHNHNDVGNFIVFADGKPAIIDVGVETYTAKTFSSKRYEIWTMQSAFHNCPTIGGVMQAAGREYAARDVRHRADDRAAEFSLDIAAAYPAVAGVDTWRRTLRLDRERNRIDVTEAYQLRKPATEITLTYMTCATPAIARNGVVALTHEEKPFVEIAHDATVFRPTIEPIPIEDARLRGVWGERIYRILLKASNAPAKGEWRVVITQPDRTAARRGTPNRMPTPAARLC